MHDLWRRSQTVQLQSSFYSYRHDDVIKWNHFPRYWPFARGIHRSPVNSPHKGQWRGALVFPLISAWINDWANNREASDLRRPMGHYNVSVMWAFASTLHLFHDAQQCMAYTDWAKCISLRLMLTQTPEPIFCILLKVNSGCAQPITGQVISVTWPVIGWV